MLSSYEVSLSNTPEDGITRVKFSSGDSSLLAVSSWDTTVRVYDTKSQNLSLLYHHEKPVLDCTFVNSEHVASAGLDKTITVFNIERGVIEKLGSHDDAVKCLLWDANKNWIVSGSWDSSIKVWDMRSSTPLVGSYCQPERVYAMDFSTNHLVVGTAGRHVWIWDVRFFSDPAQRRESSLKHQTRCIRSFINGEGYLLSSVEGRVSFEYFDPSPQVQAKKYIFKCHRVKINDIDHAYPVNCAVFHPNGTFITGGGDGYYFIWDGVNKKRLSVSKKYPTSISSIDITNNGKHMAIASSYTFEKGNIEHPPENIYIRPFDL